MLSLNTSFENYQAQYETFLPIKMKEGLTSLQKRVSETVTRIDRAFLAPELVLKVIQLAVAIFSFIPSIEFALEGPKLFCKDAKNFSNFVKGLKSIDGFLNFKFAWRHIVFNASGLLLFTFSTLSLLDRIPTINISSIKTYLTAIPIFGILPYGGLLSFSIIGLMGMITLFNVEKTNKLTQEEAKIRKKRLVFWLQPLDLPKVQEQKNHYHFKASNLQKEITHYEKLIKEGKEKEKNLNEGINRDQIYRLYVCQKALNALQSSLEKKQNELKKYEDKVSEWSILEKKWEQINPEELEKFRQAKQDQCEAKLGKIKNEKRANVLSIANNVIVFARQALVIVSVVTGYGIITLPLFVNIGLDATISGCSIANFFIKRSIKKIQTFPIKLSDYVALK